ncbi:hypothetical protein NUU61_010180 [Penicillium alfredii]|uniref:Uncharacterized protein n=1 Tax=Penicillium alfredii TaxID=1506179 RepID=A0A9W9JUG4_9EURO|nr:uncharacterized protein NUU61_010180 [Penicillium alfredii]KAJ5081916.1 hypothetical protein NUU61_010180 [Penicillium alfredii]
MRPPEMSYSPAYHQDQGPLTTTLPRHSIHIPAPAARRSQDHSSPPSAGTRPSADWPAHDASPRAGPRSLPYHSQPAEPSWPGPGPRGEDDPVVTRASLSSAAYKEDRPRGSWADPPSLMSGDQSTPSTSRVHKRGIPDDDPSDASQDALLMLFRLSLPVPIFSLCASLYTIGAVLFAILVLPARLCALSSYLRSISFTGQLCDLLSPALHVHERLVGMRPPAVSNRSASTQWIRTEPDSDLSDPSAGYSVGAAISVLVLSPLLSVAILLFAWTAAFFWVFAMVLGNPDGTERKDDGRAAVLGVCRWWQTWLGKARKES